MFAAKEDETASQEGADLQTPQPDSHTLTSSVEAIAKSGSTASIYLDDGLSEDPQPSKTPQPPRRLTMVRPSTKHFSLVEFSLIISLGDLALYPGRPVT